MEKFLYGSNVHRIQSFIFETGKLKEIIGASELVEQICTTKFREKVGDSFSKEQLLVGAAGKITYLFEDYDSCQRVVFDFHKSIWEEVPGLHLTQAVVKVKDGIITGEHLTCLEERLDTQKNKVPLQHGTGLMISERSRRTGGPAVFVDKEESYLDRKQVAKNDAQKSGRSTLFDKILGDKHDKYSSEIFALEPEQMLRDGESGWVAVIHADGNNLGQTIQSIIKKVSKERAGKDDVQKMIKSFSDKIDQATRSAAQEAFSQIVEPVYNREKVKNPKTKLPFRLVLLGGDDLTMIIRGELAVPFMNIFLKQFEHHTRNDFVDLVAQYNLSELKEGLSACAGIAYIKPKYPFHYGVDLSESLCAYAKKHAKDLKEPKVPSCLAFHRVQSSFTEEYSTILKNELTKNEITLTYMPYYLDTQHGSATIEQLIKWTKAIQEDEAPKAPIREWLTELAISTESANQLMNRIIALNPRYVNPLELKSAINEKLQTTHLQDVIALASIGKIDK